MCAKKKRIKVEDRLCPPAGRLLDCFAGARARRRAVKLSLPLSFKMAIVRLKLCDSVFCSDYHSIFINERKDEWASDLSSRRGEAAPSRGPEGFTVRDLHSSSPPSLVLAVACLKNHFSVPYHQHPTSHANMTSYLPHDIQSLLPRSSPKAAQTPSVGEQAPSFPSDIKVVQGGSASNISYSTPSKGTLVAFVRHCGCPFAEKEVKLLGEVDKKHGGQGEVQIVVVQHSDEEETRAWWKRIG